MSGRGDKNKKRGAKKQASGQSQNVTPGTEKPHLDESESTAVETGSAAPELQSPKGKEQTEAVLAEESKESAAVIEMHSTKADYEPESPAFGGTLASGKELKLKENDITEEESTLKLTTSEETIAESDAKGQENVTLTSSRVESNVNVEEDKEQDEALKQSHGEAVGHQATQLSNETEDGVMSDNGNKESQQIKGNKDLPKFVSPAMMVLGQSLETNKDSPSKIGSTQATDPGESVYKHGSKRATVDGHEMDDDDEDTPSKRLRSDLHIDIRMLFPSKVIGVLIGKGGENIKRLRNEYKVSIDIRDSNGPDGILSVSGSVDEVCETLKDTVLSISEQMSRGDDHEIRLLIHQRCAERVIGKGGMRIKELRAETGCQVKVYMDCAPFSVERVVQITGSTEQIAFCIRAMYETMAEVPPNGANMPYNPNNFDEENVTCYGGYTDDRKRRRGLVDLSGGNPLKVTSSKVYVPKEWVGVILGKDGQDKLQIEQESESKIKVSDASDSNERIIWTTGTHDQIQYAEYLLQMLIRRHAWATSY